LETLRLGQGNAAIYAAHPLPEPEANSMPWEEFCITG